MDKSKKIDQLNFYYIQEVKIMTTLEKFNHLKNLGLSVKLLSNLTNIKTSLLYKWTSGSNISIEKEQIINKALDNIQNLFDITEIATDSIKYENIANQKFNHLTALYPVGSNKAGMMQWACQCDCGNPILKITTAYALKNNETISCGCQRKSFGGKNLIDLTGKRFGQLTVLSRADNTLTDNRVQWLCQCDCGNQIVVRSESLISHKTQSCGCLTKSIGEMNIEKLLINNHFNFIKQYSFLDLKSPKNYLLKFICLTLYKIKKHLII